ncbi:unnamed protein product [Ceutorhynchus assimilis]|uniref:MICOS complex subunit n=1 Tax=Ceutorhynchus assimilis TaxID=467358 RepID=A0A9P0DMG2_9CUCU|nr:unnamed protein product [Ceutorhynchus assimilis]
MFVGAVIRKGLIPAAAVVTEVKMQNSDQVEDNEFVCRPSELPIYTPDLQSFAKQPKIVQKEEVPAPSFIQDSVKTMRRTLTKYKKEYEAYEVVAKRNLTESKQNVEWLVDYLRQEDNTLPKAGAIGIGALTGLIFGLRGGFFKRAIYATTGALAMGAVCYPKEASEYSQFATVEGKKMLTIAYNFAYGDDNADVANTSQVSLENFCPPQDEISPDNSYCPPSNNEQI